MTALPSHLMVPPAQPASPLTADHLRQMQAAQQGAKTIRRCIRVAQFDGWSVGVFGGLTLLLGVFSVWGWLLGGSMLLVAYVELGAVEQLKRLEPSAALRLGWNQVALGSVLLSYAVWSFFSVVYGPDPFAGTLATAPEAAAMLAPYGSLVRMISAAVYGVVAAVAVLAQGGTALYYFTREKHIRAYRERTPGWIVEMQQTGAQL